MRNYKYVGGSSEERMRPVTRREVERVIREQFQFGTLRERRRACMAILRRGETLYDASGYGVRLARLGGGGR